MKFAVAFITYNDSSAKYLPYFLDSLFKSLESFEKKDFLILARDNSENKDNNNSLYIEKHFNNSNSGQLISFIWSGLNLGFSKAYNSMIQEAKEWGAEAFLMINPDTIISEDAIRLLLKSLQQDSGLASVAPKILKWDFQNNKKLNLIDSCGIVVKSGLRFHDLGQGRDDDGGYDEVSILGPSGAAALFRISALDVIKKNGRYLDERMFMYKEDCDLVYRLNLASFKSTLNSKAIIYHDRSASNDRKGILGILRNRKNKNKFIRSHSFVNQHLLFIKFWKYQNILSKIKIIEQIISFFIFAVTIEQSLLVVYRQIIKFLPKNK